MKQITIRGLDRELERRVRALARAEGISLNKAVLRLLRMGAGMTPPREEEVSVGGTLDHLVGTWTEAEARAFGHAVADFERIDPGLWK